MDSEKDNYILNLNLAELEIAKSQFPEFKEVEDLKSDIAFETELKEAENKIEFLEKGIKEIDANLETFKHTDLAKFVMFSFNSNYNHSQEIDLSLKRFRRIELIGFYIGKLLSDSKKMVEAKLDELETNTSKKYKININDQLLILYYFGILETITKKNTKEKSAEILSCILTKNSQDIRERLGGFEKMLAPSEKKQMETLKAKLNKIRRIFKEYKLDTLVSQIDNDIKSLENKLDRKM